MALYEGSTYRCVDMETLCLDCRKNYVDNCGGICNECLGETGNGKEETETNHKPNLEFGNA